MAATVSFARHLGDRCPWGWTLCALRTLACDPAPSMGPRAVAVVRSPFAAVPVGWDVTPLHLPCANVASLLFFLEPFDLAGATLTVTQICGSLDLPYGVRESSLAGALVCSSDCEGGVRWTPDHRVRAGLPHVGSSLTTAQGAVTQAHWEGCTGGRTPAQEPHPLPTLRHGKYISRQFQ